MMKTRRRYGLYKDADAYPYCEGVRYRVAALAAYFRLCEYCLTSNRRCPDSSRKHAKPRSWKRYRRTQWK